MKQKGSTLGKLFSLGVQVLVLILLYQVFLRGITGDKMMKILYSWVDFGENQHIFMVCFGQYP